MHILDTSHNEEVFKFSFPLNVHISSLTQGEKGRGESGGSTERPLTVGKSIISMAKPAANSSDTARAHPCPHPGLSPRKDRAGSGGTAGPWHPGLLAGAQRGRSPREQLLTFALGVGCPRGSGAGPGCRSRGDGWR